LRRLLDRRVQAQVDAHANDRADLVVEHRLRQPERRDVGAHQAAGFAPLLEDRDFVAERHQVVRHGQRGAAGADQRDLLAVLDLRHRRQARQELVLVVGGDALQATDRHRLLFDAAATAGRLAGPVADSTEDARETRSTCDSRGRRR
jgi:hypothetical protein